MNENRGYWYLLTGIILGLILGLVYGWVVQPAPKVEADPASLQTAFKDEYRILIALAYQANGDLVRAKARLELLQDENVSQVLEQQAQRAQAQGYEEEALALARLAADLRER